jgi:hypothetical protein
MVKKTRKQKEKAAQRREYLVRLAEEKPEIKEEISKEETLEPIKTPKIHKGEAKIVPTTDYATSDFIKSLLWSGLFMVLLIVLAILDAKYRFLEPLASSLMAKIIK